jgi:hypothetical protein
MRYLHALHLPHSGPLIVVMDRLPAHHSAVRRLQERGARWLSVEWLPANAPDLNRVEALWSHAKYSALTHFVPDKSWGSLRGVVQMFHVVSRREEETIPAPSRCSALSLIRERRKL